MPSEDIIGKQLLNMNQYLILPISHHMYASDIILFNKVFGIFRILFGKHEGIL